MTSETQTTIGIDAQKTGASFDRSILQQATAAMREHAITEATRLVIGYAETSAQTMASRFQDIAAIADSLLLYSLTGAVIPPQVSDAAPLSAAKLVDLRRDVLCDALNQTQDYIDQAPDEKIKDAANIAQIMLEFILSGQLALPSPQPSPSSTASPQLQDSSAAAVSAQPPG